MAAYPDDQFLSDYEQQYMAGLGGTPTPQGWGPQPAVSPDAAGMTDGGAPAPAPAAPPASPWGGLGSLLGGGGGRGPGMSQGMIGLGLGLLAGKPWDRYSAALKGYQEGAGQDEARYAQQQQNAYRQQALAQQAEQNRIANAFRERQMQLQEGPQLVETGTNPYTNEKTYAWKYPGTTRLEPVTFGGTADQPGQYEWSKMTPNFNDQGKDEDFITALEKSDPITAKAVKDITEGRVPAQGRNLQKLLPLAARYDQNFTGAQDYQTRLATAKSFAAGKDAEVVKSYNQAILHSQKLWDLIPKIEGFNIGGATGAIINAPYGEARAATDPEYASNRQRYDQLSQELAGELMKASRCSGSGTGAGIQPIQTRFASARSGAEMRGATKGSMDFLEGAMDASAQKKSTGMKSQFTPRSLLTEGNQGTFERIQTHVEGTPQATKKETPAAPAV